MNSNLPVDLLGKIWELADHDKDGQLDAEEFAVVSSLRQSHCSVFCACVSVHQFEECLVSCLEHFHSELVRTSLFIWEPSFIESSS